MEESGQLSELSIQCSQRRHQACRWSSACSCACHMPAKAA